VVYTILVSKLSEKYNVYTIITYQNILGTLYFLPTFLIFDYKNFVSIGFNFDAFISIAALAVFGSTICYILFIYGVQHMGVTNANIFANIIPVFTAIFSVILLNEYLSPINIGGIAIVLLGLMITQINRKRLAKINIFSIKK